VRWIDGRRPGRPVDGGMGSLPRLLRRATVLPPRRVFGCGAVEWWVRMAGMSCRTPLLSILALLCVAALAFGQERQSQSGGTAPLPADAENAQKALTESPRHGEWVEIELPGSDTKLRTWVSYPERSDGAPVVIVIHEIFGLTDWIRAVADQLAAEGFVAVAPDLLSGKGPDGGGTESFEG